MTAQGIIEAWEKYPDSSFVDLCNDTLMPIELQKAHCENNEAVYEAYGWPNVFSEYDIIARLLELYDDEIILQGGCTL